MNKVVIITGASAGMGRETAIFLAQAGYTVYGGARRIEKMQDLEALGVRTMALDVTEQSSVDAFVSKVLADEGRIDVLINNAGYGEYGALEDVTMEAAHAQMEVNVFGALRMTKAVLPTMRAQAGEKISKDGAMRESSKRHAGGKIINISSIGGKMASPMGGWYHASKFAIEALSDSLRLEVKPFGIDVVVIEPGGVKTEWAGIAMDNMVEASKDGVYADFAASAKKLNMYTDRLPEPIIVARLIAKIIERRRPKARYALGYLARPILFLKRILSDRMFDTAVMSQFK